MVGLVSGPIYANLNNLDSILSASTIVVPVPYSTLIPNFGGGEMPFLK